MTERIDMDTAMKLASDAFQPYGCITGANPEDDSFALTVMNSDGTTLLSISHVHQTQYANPLRLNGVIEQARLDLAHKGCHLQPWSMPWIIDPSNLPETPPNY